MARHDNVSVFECDRKDCNVTARVEYVSLPPGWGYINLQSSWNEGEAYLCAEHYEMFSNVFDGGIFPA